MLFDGLADERFYFVHSYGVRDFPLAADGPPSPLAKPLVTWAEHGDRFVAGVENGAAVGDPVPPGEERRRRRAAADQLAADARLTCGRRRIAALAHLG